MSVPDVPHYEPECERRDCCAANVVLDQDEDTGETFMVCTACLAVCNVERYPMECDCGVDPERPEHVICSACGDDWDECECAP